MPADGHGPPLNGEASETPHPEGPRTEQRTDRVPRSLASRQAAAVDLLLRLSHAGAFSAWRSYLMMRDLERLDRIGVES